MNALTVDRRRLGNLLGMTGSDGDGEALNAIRLANRMLREAGMTWHQALGTDDAPETGRPRMDDDDDDLVVLGRWLGGWRALAADCARDGIGILSEWEITFCRNCSTIRSLSRKQAAVLRKLAERLTLEGRFA